MRVVSESFMGRGDGGGGEDACRASTVCTDFCIVVIALSEVQTIDGKVSLKVLL